MATRVTNWYRRPRSRRLTSVGEWVFVVPRLNPGMVGADFDLAGA
jgi:hypothetical protein